MSENSHDVNRRRFLQGTGVAVTGTALSSQTGLADDGVESDKREDRDETDETMSDRTRPTTIAHRGFAGMYPENTVGAVEMAAKQGPQGGAEMVEIDVVPTADGDVVVFHDDRLRSRDGGERGLTDTEGVVWETSTDVVTSAEVLDSGETVPLLSELLDALPSSVGVNVEFKNPGSFDVRFAENLSGDALETQKDVWRPFTEDVLAVVDDYDNDVLVSSFYEAALATVREADPSIPVAFLFWDDIEAGLDITRTYDCEALHPPYNLVKGTPFFGDEYYTSGPYADVDLVEVAHDEGREVNVWTIGTWYQAQELTKAGVDGLIADYPGLSGFGGGC
ncbi:glycerophosphoryl diester phosphodiesterase [Halogranum amylolyticum]|uniref:Glycerophosphoryl diester phosphodiesterase n=1 Tax=Halogranum amylolyticum TaxID=660520 RepID=A0A1H8T4M7_9EURY|nr:glycerophosphodiester phosphodiesterase [Halogranum amylolyticum]SEO85907.1 glycerophosphoryl diester phosphodiesterase [Halogranum amylolyticum]